MKIIFLGAPGAGKGTQAENASEVFAIPAISTGAIIRESIKAGTEAGKAVKVYTEAGKLVPDEIVINIIKERLAKDDCVNGFILDGFPRNVPQAEVLDAMGVEIDVALSIEVDDDRIIERMGGRRVCGSCGSTYHTLYNPSSKGDNCDKCGEALITRKDDMPEVVKNRLDIYHEETEPLKEYYAKKGKLKLVIGQEEVADTTALTVEALKSVQEDSEANNI
jgi:adenylate kinases